MKSAWPTVAHMNNPFQCRVSICCADRSGMFFWKWRGW